jgi:hypothetical protein
MNFPKAKFPLIRSVLVTLFVSGLVPTCAILSDYAGEVKIKLGTDGIQIQIVGDRSTIC